MLPGNLRTIAAAAAFAALIFAAVSHIFAAAPGRLRVNSSAARAQMEPSIAAAAGNVYAAWQSNESGEWQVMFAASRGGAKKFSRGVCLSCGIPAKKDFIPIHHQPAVAAAPGGLVFVVWQGITGDIDYDIFSSVSSDGGKTFTKPRRLNAGRPGNQQFPSIAAAAAGTAFVTWQDNRDSRSGWRIYTATVDRKGRNISGDAAISGGDAAAMNVWSRALADSSGRRASVWQCGNDVCYSATGETGGAFEVPLAQRILSSPADRQLPAACFNADGSLFIAWAGAGAKKLDVFGALLAKEKTHASPAATLNFETGNYQTQPAAAALPGGRVAVAWTDTRQTGDLAIYFNIFSTHSGEIKPLATEQRIDPPEPAGFSERPALAASPDGDIYLIYADDATGDYDIYVKTIKTK